MTSAPAIYRFHFDGARITFVSPPSQALIHAARFAGYLRRELLRIEEVRQIERARPQLVLV